MSQALRTILCGFLCMALPLAAHHAENLFDMKMPITLTGTVARVDWENPHAYLYLDVKTTDGKVQQWAVELDSPSQLERHGWKRDSVKAGDTVTCTGGPARSRAHAMKSATIELPGGKKLRS